MSETRASAAPGEAPRHTIRDLRPYDIDAVAAFEAAIAVRSFADEAVTDLDHYRRKLAKLAKGGEDWTKVLLVGGAVAGWAWVSPRRNFITDEPYADFRSLYVDGRAAGPGAAVALLAAVIDHCRAQGFTRIVGRTASGNAAMRALYGLAGFEERHIVYELDMRAEGSARG